jgi:hypothetical protein
MKYMAMVIQQFAWVDGEPFVMGMMGFWQED